MGRSLRAIIDTKAVGENTIVIDCDVLQADGGTRTAAITGAYVALVDAIEWGRERGFIGKNAKPIIDSVAAVSVGIIDGEPLLDLAYVEDVRAETDMNVVVTGRGLFVEVQGTAEGAPFDRAELDALLDLVLGGDGDAHRHPARRARSRDRRHPSASCLAAREPSRRKPAQHVEGSGDRCRPPRRSVCGSAWRAQFN